MNKLFNLLSLLLLSFSSYSQITSNDYFKKGLSKAELKDYRGAILDYTKAIELDPKSGGAYLGRGSCKGILGQKDSACLDFSKAGELGVAEAYKMIERNCQ